MRTIPDIHDLLLPLEDAITQHLIPALTGRGSCSTAERELLALPVRFGWSRPSQSRHTVLTLFAGLRDTDQTFGGSDSVSRYQPDR